MDRGRRPGVKIGTSRGKFQKQRFTCTGVRRESMRSGYLSRMSTQKDYLVEITACRLSEINITQVDGKVTCLTTNC